MKLKMTIALLLSAVLAAGAFTGCGSTSNGSSSSGSQPVSEVSEDSSQLEEESYDGKLVFDHAMELTYAENFSVDYYKGGYKLITISDGRSFLCVPEGMSTPTDLEDGVVVLQMPITNMLVSSTPTVSLIDALGAVDRVSLTTTERDSWYIENVIAQMDAGKMAFIGSYKEPDYEMITEANVTFSVFSSMLESVPEVAEKLDELGVSVLLDQSTYEPHPLGKVEWIKLYGAMFDLEEEAEAAFEAQKAKVDAISAEEKADKSVAIFYITSKNVLYARNGGDYMSKMVELAGGNYIFSDVKPEETGNSTYEFEDFYMKAKDADYIIYIWSLGGKPETLDDFVAKSDLFSDFKAVQDGNVWCTTADFFQISDTIGDMISDMHQMLLSDADTADLQYLTRLK